MVGVETLKGPRPTLIGSQNAPRKGPFWKFRSLEVWRLGQASRCAAITKDTKDHKGTQRAQRRGTADFADWEQIKGVLPHAGRWDVGLEAGRPPLFPEDAMGGVDGGADPRRPPAPS